MSVPAERFVPRASEEVKVYGPAARRARLREIIATLPVARAIAMRAFKTRWKQAALGPIWMVAQPVAMLGVFTAVFNGVTQVDTGGIPYALFSVVGVSIYTFVSVTVVTGTKVFVRERMLIRQVPCPRVAFPTSVLLAGLPQLCLLAGASVAVVLLDGRALPVQIVALPLVLAVTGIFGWALVLLLSTINVRYRDIAATAPLMLQGLLFLSPVAYPTEAAPPTTRIIMELNPLTGLIEAARWSILGSDPPTSALLATAAWTVALAVVGWQLFTRLEVRFADVI